MRVAIIHDWLETWGGSEQVLVEMLAVFPQAKLYALVDFLADAERDKLGGRISQTSFIQKLPFARKRFRHYLSLFPFAVEKFDLRAYDVIISSSHAVSKGVLTGPDQLHICMCYTPPRYLWDMREEYLNRTTLLKRWLIERQLHKLRIWDVQASLRVDRFIAISHYVARRIQKYYRRDAAVIYPPVAVDKLALAEKKADYYLTVARFVPYKRVDLLVSAFTRLPEKKLVVIGSGPEEQRIKASAGSNIHFFGRVAEEERNRLLMEAKAFVFAAEEDFGIAPLEAQACGTPVIALNRGGTAETIVDIDADRPTGVLFDLQTEAALIEAISQFERAASKIKPTACRENALRFSPQHFRRAFEAIVLEEWKTFCRRRGER